MCGQVGFSGKNNFDLDKIKTLIYINSIERGEDSTGFYSPNNGLKKCLDKGWDFVTSDKNKIELDTVFMAHVRSATVGFKTDVANAHPFKRGEWILQHNGTLKNHYPLLRKYKLKFADYNVDSDVIAGMLEAAGDFRPLSEINGSAALIIQNIKFPNKIFVFRNTERPLFRGYIGDDMYISSVEESLKLIKCDKIKEFKTDRIYCIENGAIRWTSEIKNKPYSETITTTNTTNNYNLSTHVNGKSIVYHGNKPYNLEDAVGMYIRCSENLEYNAWKNGISIPISVTKNKYYLIEGIENLWQLKILDDYNTLVDVNHKNFILDDIITKQDYIKLNCNITNTKDDTLMGKKNDIFIVSEVVTERNGNIVLSLCLPEDPNVVKIYCSNEYCVKLTNEELQTFHGLNNNDNTTDEPITEEIPFKDFVTDNDDTLGLLFTNLESINKLINDIRIVPSNINIYMDTLNTIKKLINESQSAIMREEMLEESEVVNAD